MQLIDLKAQYQKIEQQIQTRIQKVLNDGHYIMGPEVAELEQALADYVGAKHCVSCANGTDALQLALMANDVQPGDKILTTAFSFFATAEVISLMRAEAVFVDIDPVTYNIDVDQVIDKISEFEKSGDNRLKAIIAVDLFGLPADYQRLQKVCEESGLVLIEDGAQSFGSSINGVKSGCFADIATTSFFPAKPLGCYGDGGAMFTNDEKLAEILRSLRVHGKGTDKYDNVRIGLNSRLDTLQAAILLEKLAIFPGELRQRQQVAHHYSEGLASCFSVPEIPDGYCSAWAQYCLQAQSSEHRTYIMEQLAKEGIPTAIYYPKPLHLQTAFQESGYQVGDFPVSEAVSERIFSLPMHPYLDTDAIEDVIQTCRTVTMDFT